MAKVEKFNKKDVIKKWEPWVTITLSKREAAGVLTLVGGMHCNSMRLDDLYDKLSILFNQESDDLTWKLPCLAYTDSRAESSAGQDLDNLFGKA